MPIVGGHTNKKQRKQPNVFSHILGTYIKDGSDNYFIDVIGTKNGPVVRFRAFSEGQEVLRLYLSPKVALRISQVLAHAAYLAERSDVVDVLWRYVRSGAANVAEKKRFQEPQEEPGIEEETEEEKVAEEVPIEFA